MSALRGKRAMCPGPQSALMIKYLESLAKQIDVCQTKHPCSGRAPVAIYSDYGEPDSKICRSTSVNHETGGDGGGTLWKYFDKK